MLLPFRFTTSNVAALKRALRTRYADIKSSHADEAIAASFGFKSYAAMLNILRQVSTSSRLVVDASHFLLLLRLEELGYRNIEQEPLRQLLSKADYMEGWLDDDIRKFIKERFRPVPANTR